MNLKIRTFVLDFTSATQDATELDKLAGRITALAHRAEGVIMEAGRRFPTPEVWYDEKTLPYRIRGFLFALSQAKVTPAVAAADPLPEGEEEDEDEDEEDDTAAIGVSTGAAFASRSSLAGGRAPVAAHTVSLGFPPLSPAANGSRRPLSATPRSAVSASSFGRFSTPTTAAEASAAADSSAATAAAAAARSPLPLEPTPPGALAAPAREHLRTGSQASSVASLGDGERQGTSRRLNPSDFASADDFASEPVGTDGRTAFEREVRSVIKATRTAAEELRAKEAEAKVERMRHLAKHAKPANAGAKRYGEAHPYGAKWPVLVYPSQQGAGDLRLRLNLERRPSQPPSLPELNKWQHRQCAACGEGISTGSWRVMTSSDRPAVWCAFTELLFCKPCFEQWVPESLELAASQTPGVSVSAGASASASSSAGALVHAIPWRVVNDLDAGKHQVCAAARVFLAHLWRRPLVDVTTTGIMASVATSRGRAVAPRGNAKVAQAVRNLQTMVDMRRAAALHADEINAVLDEAAESVRERAGWDVEALGDAVDPAVEAGLLREDGVALGSLALETAVDNNFPAAFAYFKDSSPTHVAPAHYIGICQGLLTEKLASFVEEMAGACSKFEILASRARGAAGDT